MRLYLPSGKVLGSLLRAVCPNDSNARLELRKRPNWRLHIREDRPGKLNALIHHGLEVVVGPFGLEVKEDLRRIPRIRRPQLHRATALIPALGVHHREAEGGIRILLRPPIPREEPAETSGGFHMTRSRSSFSVTLLLW
jgi:hypothetical protein